MSDFSKGGAQSMSRYVAGLNTLSSPTDPTAPARDIHFDDDLSLFTDTQFIDFDMGQLADVGQPLDYDPAQEEWTRRHNAAAASRRLPPHLDFSQGTFHIPNMPTLGSLSSNQPITSYPIGPSSNLSVADRPASGTCSPVSPNRPLRTGEKRSIDALEDPGSPMSPESSVRVAAEEDKRRRNTAASARFRVKKKQREQALEKSAKEMIDRVSELESKVTQLEMENKWLKGLIVEKNDGREGMADLYRRFSKGGVDLRSTNDRNDGVGTSVKGLRRVK